VVVLALGEPQRYSGEAQSRVEIDLPPAQQALAEAVAMTGKPLVVLLRNGRALALEGAVREAQAIRSPGSWAARTAMPSPTWCSATTARPRACRSASRWHRASSRSSTTTRAPAGPNCRHEGVQGALARNPERGAVSVRPWPGYTTFAYGTPRLSTARLAGTRR
jgi:beta-glucosidase